MFTDVKQYREALNLMDDPEVDAEMRAELADNVRYFEHDHPDVAKRAVAELTGDEDAIAEQKMLGGVQQSSRLAGSREGMKRAGINVPRSREQYAQQYQGVKHGKAFFGNTKDEAYTVDFDPEERAEMQEGLESAYAMTPDIVPLGNEPDPEIRKQVIENIKAQQAAERGEEDQTDEQRLDEAMEQDKRQMGLAGVDKLQPNASKRTDTDLSAPPEHLPQGASFTELLQTQPWLEPPVEVVKEIFRSKGHKVDDMTAEDPRYQRFADAAWTAEYNKAKKEGRPVVRLAYMSSGDWKRQAYKAQAIALNQVAGPLAAGIDKSLTFGVATEAMTGMMGEDARKAFKQVADNAPVAKGAGQVIGAFAPGGAAARLYGGAARTVAPAAGSGLGLRMLGATGAAGITGIGESVGSDVVHNAGEFFFAGTPIYRKPGEIAERASASGVMAAPFGAAGELVGSLAGAGVRALREGRRGKALAGLEQAGMTTGGVRTVGQAGRFDTFGRKDPLAAAQKKAALEQRDIEDVLSDPVVRGMSNAELAGKGGGTLTSGRGGDLRSEVLAFRTKAGREAEDLDLLERAQEAGVADELLLLPALRGMKELQNATPSPGLSLGGGLYSYIPNAAGAIGTRLDPVMRALAMRESAPAAGHSLRTADISEDLLNFVRNLVTQKGIKTVPQRPGIVSPQSLPTPINPLRDIAEGRAGRFSARQVGASGAPQENKNRRTKFSQLTSAEQEALLELLAALERNRQLPAAVGE